VQRAQFPIEGDRAGRSGSLIEREQDLTRHDRGAVKNSSSLTTAIRVNL
jgi:hypothetical protein